MAPAKRQNFQIGKLLGKQEQLKMRETHGLSDLRLNTSPVFGWVTTTMNRLLELPVEVCQQKSGH